MLTSRKNDGGMTSNRHSSSSKDQTQILHRNSKATNMVALEKVPESSILGVGCGAPVNFADIREGGQLWALATMSRK
ncbi:MAG TPA: hypothetical protein VEH06_00750 [Candidatus Bathyarchaeia archaeon]|nr:hypothetical protein [Candidatus Bathyarchaeia archaeon]